MLQLEVSLEDVRKALFDMGPYKAPGPDRFQPIFFRRQWETMGQALFGFVKGLFEGKKDIHKVNHTFLVLIPKIPKPDKLSQFRPIGLCNTVYKSGYQSPSGQNQEGSPQAYKQ